MVRNDVTVICERGAADAAITSLGDDLPIEQFPHFRIRAEFPVSSGVLSILDSPCVFGKAAKDVFARAKLLLRGDYVGT
jgi:hypothetical protein